MKLLAWDGEKYIPVEIGLSTEDLEEILTKKGCVTKVDLDDILATKEYLTTIPQASEVKVGGGKVAPFDSSFTEPVALNEKGEFVVKKPQTIGGGGTQTEPRKIVDFTIPPEQATATSFEFTAEQYPLLAECNAFTFAYYKSINEGTPWSELWINRKKTVKTGASNQHAFHCGRFSVKSGYCNGYISGAMNVSARGELDYIFPVSGNGNNTPVLVGDTVSCVKIQSYTKFLDEGGKIEIWGWNE